MCDVADFTSGFFWEGRFWKRMRHRERERDGGRGVGETDRRPKLDTPQEKFR